MLSHSGRWTLCFNGEIYNFEALRKALPNRDWRGHSDSEVILESIEHWGIDEALKKFVGMFALAAYDHQHNTLHLARDRLGIKPLYYGWVGRQFVFASELAPIESLGSDLGLDVAAVRGYLRYGYIPAPASIYANVKKLPPGHMASLSLGTQTYVGRELNTKAYWRYSDFALQPRLELDEEEAIDELHNLLKVAVKDRLVSDVPLGAFLSGGYDSTLVCALMQSQMGRAAHTFTIGFASAQHNEAHHARQVAKHLGTHHTELELSDSDLLQAIDKLPAMCDEPFGDSSILPTHLVSALAREHVTVSLSGDGADELFWGYSRYHSAAQIWQRISRIPLPVRKIAKRVVRSRSVRRLASNFETPSWLGRPGNLSDSLLQASEFYDVGSAVESYERQMSKWTQPDALLLGDDYPSAYNDSADWTMSLPMKQRMAAQDVLMYLPGDILTKLDRASMSVSLEARVPLLDHRVVEFAARLPDQMKSNGDRNKYLMRKVLEKYVPPELTDRPKMGFGVPMADWLRGPLRQWAEERIFDNSNGLLNPEPIELAWSAHQSGHRDQSAKLWYALVLQDWLRAREL